MNKVVSGNEGLSSNLSKMILSDRRRKNLVVLVRREKEVSYRDVVLTPVTNGDGSTDSLR